jgi:hypothetical protein
LLSRDFPPLSWRAESIRPSGTGFLEALKPIVGIVARSFSLAPQFIAGLGGAAFSHSNRFNGFAGAREKPLKRFRSMGDMPTPE